METARDFRGKFRKPFYKLWTFWVVVACAAIISGGMLTDDYEFVADWYSPSELVYERAEAAEIVEPDKIEAMKADVLDRLQKCESGGKEVSIVFDSNSKPSVGNFQWQPHSFIHYYQKQHGVKLTERQAVIKALDDNEARALASYVIFETDKGVAKDWFNCSKWHGLQTLVDFVKAHD
jgi:hypothetical protein